MDMKSECPAWISRCIYIIESRCDVIGASYNLNKQFDIAWTASFPLTSRTMTLIPDPADGGGAVLGINDH